MKFISEDGKVFETIEDCQTHEKELEESKNAEEIKKKQIKEAKEKIDEVLTSVDDLVSSYNELTGCNYMLCTKNGKASLVKLINRMDLFDEIFKRF